MNQEIRWQQRFTNMQKALDNLNETCDYAQNHGLTKIYTMALIQAFEISFELCWKTMKDYLEYSGIKATTPRDVIKEAFANELIEDGQSWIDMMEARNKTSHTYQEEYARELTTDILNTHKNLMEKLQIVLQGKLNG